MVKQLLMVISAVALVIVNAQNAQATTPLLTPLPKPANAQTCEQWASIQSDDVKDMWGYNEDGSQSTIVALGRLVRSCLGQGEPEIIGIFSSAGVHDEYCSKHGDQGICKPHANSKKRQTLEENLIRDFSIASTEERVSSLPCKELENIFNHINPGSFLKRAFVDSYPELVPSKDWSSPVFNALAERAASCFQGNPRMRFTSQIGLKAMANSLQATLQTRLAAADEERRQRQVAIRKVEIDLRSAETVSATADQLQNAINVVQDDLTDTSLSEVDRKGVATRLAALAIKRSKLHDQEVVDFAAQKASRDAQAASEDAEIAKLEDQNRQKEAARQDETARKDRLEAARRKAAELVEEDRRQEAQPQEAEQKRRTAIVALDQAVQDANAVSDPDKMNAAIAIVRKAAADSAIKDDDRLKFKDRIEALERKLIDLTQQAQANDAELDADRDQMNDNNQVSQPSPSESESQAGDKAKILNALPDAVRGIMPEECIKSLLEEISYKNKFENSDFLIRAIQLGEAGEKVESCATIKDFTARTDTLRSKILLCIRTIDSRPSSSQFLNFEQKYIFEATQLNQGVQKFGFILQKLGCD